MTQQPKLLAHAWIDAHKQELSRWHKIIWNYAEPAWREYKSVEWYVNKLSEAGFEVEKGSAGMPTAFCAKWSNGDGPTIAGYAEYDAVPGNCQKASTSQEPRDGLSRYAPGHTDPHSALGIGALAGFLAAKESMTKNNIQGTLLFFGEPAEKCRGSKPLHAAAGYYDNIDAALSFHPFYMMPLCNTTRWNTHCGAGYSAAYTFRCNDPENWLSALGGSPIPASHATPRAPGANDALVNMYSVSKMIKESMHSTTSAWSLNEAILTTGQATADNLPAQIAQIIYMVRASTVDMAESVFKVLDRNAAAAASVSHCEVEKTWVCKSRPGLANHVMAELTFKNLEEVGAPQWGEEAIEVAREMQKNLGLTPLDKPFLAATEKLITPQIAEKQLRSLIPDWIENFTSDDYTEFCWHAPTARIYIARPTLTGPDGFAYPAWVMNALGGIESCIDPTIITAGKTIAGSIIDLLTQPEKLKQAKDEFEKRTGGGINGSKWIPPLCDHRAPLDLSWPEYIDTPRGKDLWSVSKDVDKK